ncbi:PH domain-containing protein [Microbacterium sp.]|uniref:PH domain-containing protein n=1 Tax=Microbacterium sp. TaxID=51671 RepID=UPI002810DA5C|nr:PH domain-containing protein [Microbacterium sp.]
MTDPQVPDTVAPPALAGGGSSSLADGDWHRLHPLTPLFQGGLVLIVVAGIVLSNFRDHAVFWVVSIFAPGEVDEIDGGEGEFLGFLFENNLILLGLAILLAAILVLIAVFWVVWRFHQFRITGDDVEVRKGIVFRSHRRAPLDRVQGVNLTRPFPARLIGMAKLEVVGAGTDANVPLEYLSTDRAEQVRADILRLASGARAARQAARDAASGVQTGVRGRLVDALNSGVTGMIEGVDNTDVAPESVVKIPAGRLVAAQLLNGAMWIVLFAVIWLTSVLVPLLLADTGSERVVISLGVGLGTGIPMAFAAIAITWSQISKSLRYAIAPTPDGVRVTFGLFTTVTETLPPGRIFAVEVSQSLLWRPFGWWTVKINRMSGKSAVEQQSGSGQQFNTVLPVGTRADVERVLSLILPGVPDADAPLLWDHGLLGPMAGQPDPYRTIPRRAWWRRPVSWKRHGFALTPYALVLRRGVVWRKLALFPLARLQGVSIQQGPVDRWQRVAAAQVHTVLGPVSGHVVGLERDDVIGLLEDTSRGAVAAAAADQSHRWLQHLSAPEAAPDAAPDLAPVPPVAAPVPPAAAPVPPAADRGPVT